MPSSSPAPWPLAPPSRLAADADFNGKITLAEFLAAADRHFGELDVSGAGFLTRQGLPKTLIQERRGRGAAGRG